MSENILLILGGLYLLIGLCFMVGYLILTRKDFDVRGESNYACKESGHLLNIVICWPILAVVVLGLLLWD